MKRTLMGLALVLFVSTACDAETSTPATQSPGRPAPVRTPAPVLTPTSVPAATATAVRTGDVQDVTFDELFASPDRYNGRDIVLTGFYFHGFESTLLSEKLEFSGRAEGHLWPRGEKLWVENNAIPREIYDQLPQQQMLGPIERYGKLRIKGRFEYGGRYGHGGGLNAQIVPSDVELLPWSPPPTPTPPPTADLIDTPTATPTPSVIQEWTLEGIRVEGSTVTVDLHVFAGIDVDVTLDGGPPDEVSGPFPVLRHVFKNVAPGQHSVRVLDVVGFAKTREIVVP